MPADAQRFRVRATLALAAVVSVFFFSFGVPACATPASNCHEAPPCANQCARAPYAAPRYAVASQQQVAAIKDKPGVLAPAARVVHTTAFSLARDTGPARQAALPPLHPLRIHLRYTVLLT